MLLITLLIGCLLIIIVQLVKVQIVDHQFYFQWALDQRVKAIEMHQPPRGTIHDRNGYLLAGNVVRYRVDAAPVHVAGVEDTAVDLASLLHVPALHVKRVLESRDEQGNLRPWVIVAPSVSKEVGEQVASEGIGGVTVRPLWEREYPEGTLACHALGFSTVMTGYYGVEGLYDSMLQPEPVTWEGPVDISSVPVPWKPVFGEFPRQGVRLELTLDRTIQGLAEEELARAIHEYQAEGGTVIVMDPRTFAILAMASWPAYDPARYAELVEEEQPPFEDPAVSKQYEPGSVFKIMTVAAGLDAGVVTPETVYQDKGSIEVGGQAIWNATRQAYGEQSVADILIKSLNAGAAWLSQKMGPDIFYRYLQDFGIGQATHVDLDGEVTGQLWLPDDIEHWYPSNLGTNAFGQGVAATPLQVIAAVATVANDGARMQPHIVGRRIASDGTVSVFQPVLAQQVISPQTAHTVSEILVRAVDEGTPLAHVEGYRVAGKTGTAEIPVAGGYAQEGTIATFVGFGPVPDPQVIILVKLDRPKTASTASKTAAPAFQSLASRLFVVMGIPPEGAGLLAETGP